MSRKQHMLEPLMASLLTLDWEISSQTIGKFEKELKTLREKVSDDPHSKKLIDVALPICNYLRVRKSSASPASMQFLHQAIRSLHSLGQQRQLAGEERTERVEKLVNNFGDLMAEVQKINVTLDRTSTTKSLPGTTKVTAGKKEQARKPAVRKTKKESPKVEILKAIKSHKNGIDMAALVKISGCAGSTVRKVVYRAAKEGTIKRVRRGVYVIA